MGSENVHGCAQNAENSFGFDFFKPYYKDGDEFLNHIVRILGDETRVSFGSVETKEESKPKKFKKASARKLMATVFWDRKGVLMVEFMQQGTTITSEVYCETLKSCVGPAIQNKRRGMLTYSVVLLHESARPHTAAGTRAGAFQLGVV
jgi:hypothetical protein